MATLEELAREAVRAKIAFWDAEIQIEQLLDRELELDGLITNIAIVVADPDSQFDVDELVKDINEMAMAAPALEEPKDGIPKLTGEADSC